MEALTGGPVVVVAEMPRRYAPSHVVNQRTRPRIKRRVPGIGRRELLKWVETAMAEVVPSVVIQRTLTELGIPQPPKLRLQVLQYLPEWVEKCVAAITRLDALGLDDIFLGFSTILYPMTDFIARLPPNFPPPKQAQAADLDTAPDQPQGCTSDDIDIFKTLSSQVRKRAAWDMASMWPSPTDSNGTLTALIDDITKWLARPLMTEQSSEPKSEVLFDKGKQETLKDIVYSTRKHLWDVKKARIQERVAKILLKSQQGTDNGDEDEETKTYYADLELKLKYVVDLAEQIADDLLKGGSDKINGLIEALETIKELANRLLERLNETGEGEHETSPGVSARPNAPGRHGLPIERLEVDDGSQV